MSTMIQESAKGEWLSGTSLLMVFLFLLSGCHAQTDGPERFDLAGKVTYRGEPVPSGSIMFEPDFEKGNSGPGSYAIIQNGTYRTEPDKGVVGGPYLARIQGFDGVAYSNEEGLQQSGHPLFQEQVVYFDAAKEKSTQDLEVVVSDKKK